MNFRKSPEMHFVKVFRCPSDAKSSANCHELSDEWAVVYGSLLRNFSAILQFYFYNFIPIIYFFEYTNNNEICLTP